MHSLLTREYLEKEYIENRRSGDAIADELGILKDRVYYWLKKYSIPIRNCSEAKMTKEMVSVPDGYKLCSTCKQILPAGQFCKCSSVRSGRNFQCKTCASKKAKQNIEKKTFRLREAKATLVYEMGNKCSICGSENLPIAVFAFHHINPAEKDSIVFKNSTYSSERFIREIKEKCVLVCMNCHQALHHGNVTAKEVLERKD